MNIANLDAVAIGWPITRNPGDKPVLVVEGEHFLGGDQNRATNATVLVPALGDLEIPVSCLEQGRWGRRRPTKRHKSFTPSRLRAAKTASVADSMRRSRSRRSDQGAVWREVDDMLDRASVRSDTAAAADLERAQRRESSRAAAIDKLVARGPLPGQCGLVVAHGREVMAMDLFGAPHLFAAHWGALIRSHLVESPTAEGTPSVTRVLEVVRRFAAAKAQETPGVGLGVEHRVADEGLTGYALTLDGAVVHSAFFTSPSGEESPDNGGGGEEGPRREPDLGDRARGLTAGLGAGNLLGIAMEGWRRTRIASRFPDGVREIEARTGYPDDDDIAQAVVLAEAAEQGPLDVDDLGRRFWHWAETNGAGMGGLTRDVMRLHGGARPQRLARNRLSGTPREAAGVPITEASRTAWCGSRAGNGAAMRCAPLAIRWFDDPAALVRNSIVSAVPTHWDPRCGWSCALLVLAAAAALRGESMTADGLLDAALDGVRAALPELRRYGYEASVPEAVREAVQRAAESGIDGLQLDGEANGYTLLAMQVGLTTWWRAPDFEHGLRRVIEAGGDTDTNGAVAGAILGARFGIQAIPPRWSRRIAEIRAGRTPLESYGDRLLAVREGGGS